MTIALPTHLAERAAGFGVDLNSALLVTQFPFQPLEFFELFQIRGDASVRLGDSKFLVKFVESFFTFLYRS